MRNEDPVDGGRGGCLPAQCDARGIRNEDPLNDRRGLCLPTPNAARMAPAGNAHVVP